MPTNKDTTSRPATSYDSPSDAAVAAARTPVASTTTTPPLPPPTALSTCSGEKYERTYRRFVLYGLTFVLVSASAGLVYGWPALRLHLIDDDGSTLTEQEFGLIFTVGSWSTQGGRFFVGLARDKFGTRDVLCFCLVLTTLGIIGVALSDPDNVAALSVSVGVMGLGSGVQLCSQPVASLFPTHAGAVTTSLSGAFQISGLIFLALTSGPMDRKTSFLIFAASLIVLTVVSASLYPVGGSFLLDDIYNEEEKKQMDKTSVTSVERSEHHCDERADAVLEKVEDRQCSQPESDGPDINDIEADETSSRRIDNSLPEPLTAFKQMKTKEYIFLLSWFTICLVPMQYYVGIIGYLLEQRGDDSGFYSKMFAWVYAGATVVSPFAGSLADFCGLGIAQGIATLLVAGSFFFLASDARLEVQSVGMVAYGVGRLAIFGYYFANIGARFGYAHFGTLAGVGLLVSAIASLLQLILIDLAASGHDVVVNVSLGVVLLSMFPYFIWLYRRQKQYQQATDV